MTVKLYADEDCPGPVMRAPRDAGFDVVSKRNVKRGAADDDVLRLSHLAEGERFVSFREARDYKRAWADYDRLAPKDRARKVPPRRDLRKEALVEILDGKRLVHVHCYRADEILMMIRLADEPGEVVGAAAIKYINRLSDFLFVAARHVNGRGADDVLWVPGKNA